MLSSRKVVLWRRLGFFLAFCFPISSMFCVVIGGIEGDICGSCGVPEGFVGEWGEV